MTDFQQDGYEIVRQLLDAERINYLKREIKHHLNAKSTHGIRHLDKKVPAIAKIANSPLIRDRLKVYTQENPQLVRAIYFNKTPENNWLVGWHQDKTISVRKKIATPGFINWTVKQGIVSVQPPLTVMQRIITVRIHLDRASNDNGALQVIPASHRKILNASQIYSITTSSKSITCSANAGDALVMSPLILHKSLKAKFNFDVYSIKERAIVHLEYARTKLPNNLQWN